METVQSKASQAGRLVTLRPGHPEDGAFKLAVMDAIQSRDLRHLPMPKVVEWAERAVRQTWPDAEFVYDPALLAIN
jgi:hypothetical protein